MGRWGGRFNLDHVRPALSREQQALVARFELPATLSPGEGPFPTMANSRGEPIPGRPDFFGDEVFWRLGSEQSSPKHASRTQRNPKGRVKTSPLPAGRRAESAALIDSYDDVTAGIEAELVKMIETKGQEADYLAQQLAEREMVTEGAFFQLQSCSTFLVDLLDELTQANRELLLERRRQSAREAARNAAEHNCQQLRVALEEELSTITALQRQLSISEDSLGKALESAKISFMQASDSVQPTAPIGRAAARRTAPKLPRHQGPDDGSFGAVPHRRAPKPSATARPNLSNSRIDTSASKVAEVKERCACFLRHCCFGGGRA